MVILIRNGRVVLKEEDGKDKTIVRESDANITVTVIDDKDEPPLSTFQGDAIITPWKTDGTYCSMKCLFPSNY
jgi:hypothetical protein